MIGCIFWDYAVRPEDILAILSGKRNPGGSLDRRRILIRMCERLNWYDILNIVGVDFLRRNLDHAVVEGIRFPEIRERYRAL